YKSFFDAPNIAALTTQLEQATFVPILPAKSAEAYPLSPAQHRLWVLSQLEGGSLAYNMPAAVQLKGKLRIPLFEKALAASIARHEILRTSFKVNGEGQVQQFITPAHAIQFKLDRIDLSTSEQPATELDNYLATANQFEFDLEKAPLLHASLLQLATDEFICFLTLHHLIADGWSIELLTAEVMQHYNTLLLNKPPHLAPLKNQYKDYVVWLNDRLSNDAYQSARAYWLTQLEGTLPVLNLPAFRPRPTIQTYRGACQTKHYDAQWLSQLKNFSEAQEVTLFMLLLAGINALFYRYTEQEDILLGTPSAGRDHPDLEDQMGLYLNTLAIRTRFAGHWTFSQLLASQKTTLLDAYEHQHYPFDLLIDQLNLKRDTSRSALFDVLVVLQNQQQLNNLNTVGQFQDLTIDEYPFHDQTAQFDLSLIFVERDGLELTIEFNTDIYDPILIDHLFGHLENLLMSATEKPHLAIADLPYLGPTEKHRLLVDNNQTEVALATNKNVIEQFQERASLQPEATALVFGQSSMTYRELNEQANQMADFLSKKHQVGRHDLIGVRFEPSFPMMVSVLGVLKAGAAYVPMDSALPEERLAFITQDIDAKVILDAEKYAQFENEQELYRRDNRPMVNSPEDSIYVIYTSGTTGQPKGVVIEHRSVNNLIDWFSKQFNITPDTRAVHLTPLFFDPSVEDLFSTLTRGGQLHLLSKDHLLDWVQLRRYLEQHGITILNYVPQLLHELLSNQSKIASIQQIITGGEALPEHIKKALLEAGYRLFNNYGPTETTVDALSGEMGAQEVNIGYPINNVQAYILDHQKQVVPIGVKGRLYVAGAGVAKAYLNRPDLTEAKFIPNPFVPGSRMYDTGDLCKWGPEGAIYFLGRNDQQVKIRGYRIELAAIVQTILTYSDDLAEAIVVAKKKGEETILVAYCVGTVPLDKSQLRFFLKTQLPDYMVPAYFVELDGIPLTANGKVDEKALPNPVQKDLVQATYIGPRNEVESQLLALWQEVLGITEIGVKD
ncbi:MAG: amino acid adenylation domain-containing protein, partial [Bacteroidota bacterium]